MNGRTNGQVQKQLERQMEKGLEQGFPWQALSKFANSSRTAAEFSHWFFPDVNIEKTRRNRCLRPTGNFGKWQSRSGIKRKRGSNIVSWDILILVVGPCLNKDRKTGMHWILVGTNSFTSERRNSAHRTDFFESFEIGVPPDKLQVQRHRKWTMRKIGPGWNTWRSEEYCIGN
jgi:hypothetical protein